MSAVIAYDISSQQAVTATFTKLQQQLLAQVTASSGLTWFMDNRKEMYTFAKRASNRKFKKEIEAKWLITRTLSALKEKTDELIREFFDNPHTKTACAITKAAQELRKRQQSEGGQADQSSVDSRKKGERVAEAEDAMEVDGTGPSGMPKTPAPKEKVPTALKRRNVENNEGQKVVRGHSGVQSKPRGPRRSPTVDEEEMKVIKKKEFDTLIRLRIETLDEAMRRQMEKGKGKATDLAASGAGKATDEITVCKIVAPKKCVTAKSKSMVGSETDEAGKAGPPVAGPSKKGFHGSAEGRDSGAKHVWNDPLAVAWADQQCRQKKVWCERVRELDNPNSLISQMRRQREEVPPVPAKWQVFVQETNRRMDDMARQIGDLGREVNRRLESNSNKLDSVDQGLKLVLDMLSRNGLADAEGSVEQRSKLAYQAVGSTYKRTLVGEWAQRHFNTPITPIVAEPAEPALAVESMHYSGATAQSVLHCSGAKA
ncbi:hypothetical protein BDN71DRAFT_1433940 [Pleurotus eryngii]|uniref:Uncharacterized protein n=1 Tax=Pleurotus eryngii TaxID=5323 RepID=A0A9P5ZTG7_PLEER|nr:hypothetical protein BDN71DRAFT_1433940 [Pleurotus eryngii]